MLFSQRAQKFAHRLGAALLAGSLLSSPWWTPAAGQPALRQNGDSPFIIEWEVKHRFRLVKPGLGPPMQYRWLHSKLFDRSADSDDNLIPSDALHRQITFDNHEELSYDANDHSFGKSFLFPRSFVVRLSIRNALAEAVCEWRIGGSSPARSLCSEYDVEVPSDEVEVSARVMEQSELTHSATTKIKVNDVLIVVMGDSYASGEGNPDAVCGAGAKVDRGGNCINDNSEALWLDSNCHRSLLSWPILGAWEFAIEHKHHSVAVASFACSGAKLEDGLLSEQIDPPGKVPLRPQIEAARQALCGMTASGREANALQPPRCRDGRAKPDLVVLSIGGNDAGFAPFVSAALDGRVKVTAGADGGTLRTEYAEMETTHRPLEDITEVRYDRYPKLNTQLQRAFEIDAASILIATYPDPSHLSAHLFCSDKRLPHAISSGKFDDHCPVVKAQDGLRDVFFELVKGTTGKYALDAEKVQLMHDQFLLPMNNAIRANASKFSWTPFELYENPKQQEPPYGYCLCDTSRTTVYHQSKKLQGDNLGTLHPNKRGTLVYAERLNTYLESRFKNSLSASKQ
jgi:hypothetical protein